MLAGREVELSTKLRPDRRLQARIAPETRFPLDRVFCQAVETERGVQVYQTAISLARNGDLRKEWQEYLEQTRHHVEVITSVCEKLGLDPETETHGRKVVRPFARSLIKAMEEAADAGDPAAAELVAAECVTHAEIVSA